MNCNLNTINCNTLQYIEINCNSVVINCNSVVINCNPVVINCNSGGKIIAINSISCKNCNK